MKKLIMGVAIAMLAGFASAASVNWSCAGKTFGPSSADPATNGRAKNYLVYAFAAADYSTVTANLSAGKITDAVGLAKSSARTGTSGAASGTIEGISGATYDIFLVAFDTYTAADAGLDTAKNYIVSATLSGATYVPPATATSIDYDSTNFGAGTWQPAAAPEPTSGLLLLLGMAGLALKRKRA